MVFIKLFGPGVHRVIRGEEGMIFPVDKFSNGLMGDVAHIRDYRFDGTLGYVIWSIPADGYEVFFSNTENNGTIVYLNGEEVGEAAGY
jgi:hypothetical protein